MKRTLILALLCSCAAQSSDTRQHLRATMHTEKSAEAVSTCIQARWLDAYPAPALKTPMAGGFTVQVIDLGPQMIADATAVGGGAEVKVFGKYDHFGLTEAARSCM